MKSNNKFEQFASRELENIKDSVIVPDARGGFILFGCYHLQPQKGHYVLKRPGSTDLKFSCKKSAFAWCVCDKLNHINLASQILVFDNLKLMLETDIKARKTIANASSNVSFKETVMTKLQPKQASLEAINTELEKCVNSAKYWQIRGFSNETN